jgi:hypothetical protein
MPHHLPSMQAAVGRGLLQFLDLKTPRNQQGLAL